MDSVYPTVNPTGVTVPASKSIINGDSQLIVPIVAPANASNKDVIWTSSNNAVASVVNGVVTAKSVGTARIGTAKTRRSAGHGQHRGYRYSGNRLTVS